MAKNLKINIKNLQLAGALQIKKPILKKKEPVVEDAAALKEAEGAKKRKTRLIQEPVQDGEETKIIVDAVSSTEMEQEVVEEVSLQDEPSSLPEKEIPTPKETPKPEAAGPTASAPKFAPPPPSSAPPGAPRPAKDTKPGKKKEEARFDSRDRQGLRDIDNEAWRKRRAYKPQKRVVAQEDIVRPKQLSVRLPITLKDLAQAMKLKASQLIAKLFKQGLTYTLNDLLEDETTIQLLGHDFDCTITIDTTEEERIRITDQTIQQEIDATDPNLLVLRPPVVTFMGHVDHGKTSLIDAIRKSNRVAGEAGAITQHIGAFTVQTLAGEVAILDTPGHEAFSQMRSRGANVTDIVILVVAGDEGMRAQTDEAIRQAREAAVPILVAINKSDKPNFDTQKVYRELADRELLPEAWGGTTITVNCSATTGEGVKELLEMIALQAEVLELRANPRSRARGTVLESEMHKGMGAVATVLIQNGTLHKNDAIVFGTCFGKIKTMQNDHLQPLQSAPPSTPVKITGLSELAEAGSEFIVVKSEKEARELAMARLEESKQKMLAQKKMGSMEKMLAKKESGEKKVLPVVLRADVQGSLEALKTSLAKIHSEKVRLEIVSADVGEISESDIDLAAASKATIVGFHTRIESRADDLIKQKKVLVYTEDVIYHLLDEVKERMRQLLDKIEQETTKGQAMVKAVFTSSHLGKIAGCQVIDGTIQRSHLLRQIRDKEVIWKGKMASLKRVKEDVREVQKGLECGIVLEGRSDLLEGDILESYEITYLEQDL